MKPSPIDLNRGPPGFDTPVLGLPSTIYSESLRLKLAPCTISVYSNTINVQPLLYTNSCQEPTTETLVNSLGVMCTLQLIHAQPFFLGPSEELLLV